MPSYDKKKKKLLKGNNNHVLGREGTFKCQNSFTRMIAYYLGIRSFYLVKIIQTPFFI